MKIVLLRLEYSSYYSSSQIFSEIEKWRETETGLWATANIARENIELCKAPSLSFGYAYEVVAEIEPELYTYWQLRFA